MRHKYETRGIVLARAPSGEANAFVTLITPDLGMVRARVQSLRRSGAKLAPALVTFAESEVLLVRGREGWRIVGAILRENWFARMRRSAAYARAARVCQLLLRLVAGEERNPALFSVLAGLFEALATLPEEERDAAEVLAVLRVLAALGLDAGTIPGEPAAFAPALLAEVAAARARYITRINRGIAASGL